MRAFLGRAWPAAALIAAWLAFTWAPLSRPGLFDEEATFSMGAYRMRQSGRFDPMVAQYVGSLQSALTYAVETRVAPSVEEVRSISLGIGIGLALAFFALAESFLGGAAAVWALLFFLLDPNFLLLARQDWTGIPLAALLAAAGGAAFLRWWRGGSPWALLSAAALAGLAGWTWLMVLLPIGAGLLACALLRFPELKAKAASRPWAAPAAAAAFLLALSPTIARNLRDMGLFMRVWEDVRTRTLAGMLAQNVRLLAEGLQDQNVLSTVEAARQALPIAGTLALALACGAWLSAPRWRDRLALPAAAGGVAAAAAVFVPLMTGPHHVFLVFFPALALAFGAACGGVLARADLPASGRWLALAPALLCLGLRAADSRELARLLAEGSPFWSDRMSRSDQALSRFLADRQETIVPFEFGLLHKIPVLTHGRGRIISSEGQYWQATGPNPTPLNNLIGADNLYLLYHRTGFPLAHERLFSAIKKTGLLPRLIASLGSGDSQIDVYQAARPTPAPRRSRAAALMSGHAATSRP